MGKEALRDLVFFAELFMHIDPTAQDSFYKWQSPTHVQFRLTTTKECIGLWNGLAHRLTLEP